LDTCADGFFLSIVVLQKVQAGLLSAPGQEEYDLQRGFVGRKVICCLNSQLPHATNLLFHAVETICGLVQLISLAIELGTGDRGRFASAAFIACRHAIE
jgi:hypothetical protein